MNIWLLCNRDIPSLYALNLLLPRLDGHSIRIGQSTRVGAQQSLPVALQQFAAFESQQLTGSGGDYLNDYVRELGEGALWARTFADVQDSGGFSITPMDGINAESGLAILAEAVPDLILSIRFGKILQQAAIDIPRYGVINLHSGRLPAYQGVMATFWAMLQGDKSIGSCLHYISDKRIDAGAIIEQCRIPADPGRSYLHNVLSLYPPGVSMMAEAVRCIAQGHGLPASPQTTAATYYGFPDAEEIERFLAAGFTLY